jgi:phosphoribosylamine-glycine ligase
LRTAYLGVEQIHFEGVHYRRDIGVHAIQLQAAGD